MPTRPGSACSGWGNSVRNEERLGVSYKAAYALKTSPQKFCGLCCLYMAHRQGVCTQFPHSRRGMLWRNYFGSPGNSLDFSFARTYIALVISDRISRTCEPQKSKHLQFMQVLFCGLSRGGGCRTGGKRAEKSRSQGRRRAAADENLRDA